MMTGSERRSANSRNSAVASARMTRLPAAAAALDWRQSGPWPVRSTPRPAPVWTTVTAGPGRDRSSHRPSARRVADPRARDRDGPTARCERPLASHRLHRRGLVTHHVAFDTGRAMAAISTHWNDSMFSIAELACPVIAISGMESARAVVQARDKIRGPRTGRADGQRHPSRGPAVPVGRMHGALFMPGDVMLDVRTLQVLVDPGLSPPPESECGCNPLVLEYPHYNFRCLHAWHSLRRRLLAAAITMYPATPTRVKRVPASG